MASDERTKARDLSRFDALKDHPEKFHIFQAMRLIEAQYKDKPRLGRSRRPKQDPVRLKQRIDMAFASSTVARFEPRDEKTGEPGELSQFMFGLFGPNGPLPLHMTEYAFNRERSYRDPTFKAFGDIFHHRMLSLLYRAYASGEPTSSYDRANEVDPFAQKVAAFIGLKGKAFSNRDAMPDLAKLRYAGRLAHGTRNEEGLLALISGFFGAPATMESFVGTWLELDPKDTWELGNPEKPAKLGQSCSIGSKVWTRQAKFRFRVGPVSLAEYKRLLPGGDSLNRLKSLVNNYMGDALMWDMNLVLAKGEAEPAVLGGRVSDEEVSVVVSHEETLVPDFEQGPSVEDRIFDQPIDGGMTDPWGVDGDATIAEAGDAWDEAAQVPTEPAGDATDEGGGDNPFGPSDADHPFEQGAAVEVSGTEIPVGDSAAEMEGVEPLSGDDTGNSSDIDDENSQDAGKAPADDDTPLDLEKTVVMPFMAPKKPPVAVSEDINFGATTGDFGSDDGNIQEIPPISDDQGHEDDTRSAPQGVYLGWTTWLGTPPDDKDLDQLFIQSNAQPGE